jgi:hypothetical protein
MKDLPNWEKKEKLSNKNIQASLQRPKLKLKTVFWQMAYQNHSKGVQKFSFQ